MTFDCVGSTFHERSLVIGAGTWHPSIAMHTQANQFSVVCLLDVNRKRQSMVKSKQNTSRHWIGHLQWKLEEAASMREEEAAKRESAPILNKESGSMKRYFHVPAWSHRLPTHWNCKTDILNHFLPTSQVCHLGGCFAVCLKHLSWTQTILGRRHARGRGQLTSTRLRTLSKRGALARKLGALSDFTMRGHRRGKLLAKGTFVHWMTRLRLAAAVS
jgi:hypothetical protein